MYDHGFFLPVARKLAESFGRVYYTTPWEKAYPSLNDAILGDGFGDVSRVNDLWEVKSKVDLFVFPDIYHCGMQKELAEQGYRVWGARDGMDLEVKREFFLSKLKELGLDVPEYEVVVGVSALRNYLRDKENIYIKLSKYRGSFETKCFRNWKLDEGLLDLWAVRFGGVREAIRFICFPEIETKLEIGCDTYNVDGRWPSWVLHGIEKKDSAYLSSVTALDAMPEELTDIMHRFSGYLASVNYRQFWSMEVRVAEEGNFFIDATTRGGLPSTASQMDLWKNYAEILWHGADGEMVEPQYEENYSAECMVKVHGEDGAWESIDLDPELKKHVKLCDCCEVGDLAWFPSDEKAIEEVGWLCTTGGTPTEVAKEMNRLADMLPDGADAAVESLADIIREVEEANSKGIPFADDPMPDPEIVLEPSQE